MQESLYALFIALVVLTVVVLIGKLLLRLTRAIRSHPFIAHINKCIKFRPWFGFWPQEKKQEGVDSVLEELAARYLFYCELEPYIRKVYTIFAASSFNVSSVVLDLHNKEILRTRKEIERRKKTFWGRATLARDFGFEVSEKTWDYIRNLDSTKIQSQE